MAMTFRPVTMTDGATTFDLLDYRLKKSVAPSCKHPRKTCVSSSASGSDTYFITSWCPDCQTSVREELTAAELDREMTEWERGA